MSNFSFNPNGLEMYCTKCGYMQLETTTGRSIQIPCPRCGNNRFSSNPNDKGYSEMDALK